MKSLVPGSIAKLLLLQLLLVVATTVVSLIFGNEFYAYSALLGGLVCTLPNWIFAVIAFRQRGAHAAQRIVANFYWGEAIKLIVTVGLFAWVLVFFQVAPLTFIIAFIIAQTTFWFAPLVTR